MPDGDGHWYSASDPPTDGRDYSRYLWQYYERSRRSSLYAARNERSAGVQKAIEIL